MRQFSVKEYTLYKDKEKQEPIVAVADDYIAGLIKVGANYYLCNLESGETIETTLNFTDENKLINHFKEFESLIGIKEL